MTEDAPGLPAVPTVNVDRVLSLRDKLADYLMGYDGERPTGDRFHSLVRGLTKLMPGGCRNQAVALSAGHLAGQPVTASAAVALAWRMAAGVDTLKKGFAVLPQTWRSVAHWAFLQVQTVRPVVVFPEDKAKRQRGAHLRLLALTGPAAGLSFRKFCSIDLIRFVAPLAGFPKPYRDGAFDDERQLAGFRLAAFLEPERIRDDQPGFKHLRVPPGLVRWNRTLIVLRDREKSTCVRALPLTVACHTCPAGLDECPAACHPRTYDPRSCPRCGIVAYFDPDPANLHPDICVGCGRRVDLAQMRR